MKFIDMHCDTIGELYCKRNMDLGKNPLCVDLEKLHAAESIVQFFACFIDVRKFQGEDKFLQGYQYALDMIAFAKKEFGKYATKIGPITSYKDMETNCAKQKISALLTIEEGGIIAGDKKRLIQLFNLGIRLITLTWNAENCIGFPNSFDVAIMQKGLKPFGIEVVECMNDLGVIVDVSHLSDGGFWDVLRYSKMPVVASHSNARALCNHPRNLTDEMIRALAMQGGIAGVNFYPYFVRKSGKASVEDLVNHIEHMYQLGGEDFVAIGTDFDGFYDGELEMEHIGAIEKLHHTLVRRGFSERQNEKFWSKNVLRVMREVL